MNKDSRIYIAGHKGMVGSAILRKLNKEGYKNLILRSSKELDLINQESVVKFFKEENPEYVFLSAAKVGGILANHKYKAEFLYKNMMIQNNLIHHAYVSNVKKLLFLGSSCIYPKMAPQPLKEEYLMTGPLESTNEAYAIAKISGIKMCQFYRDQYGCEFISIMPTNLYGKNDNYDLETSHLVAALLRKFKEAKDHGFNSVEIWGDGTPMREFLHVDDCASACVFLMRNYNNIDPINVGMGVDYSIQQVVDIIKKKFNYSGEIIYNKSYPNGTPRKLLDVTRLNKLGWKHSISFEEGIDMTIRDLELENY